MHDSLYVNFIPTLCHGVDFSRQESNSGVVEMAEVAPGFAAGGNLREFLFMQLHEVPLKFDK